MSLAPVVEFYEKVSDQKIGTVNLPQWDAGIVRAGNSSDIFNLRVWNNRGNAVDRAATMQGCRLYIVDNLGTREAQVAKDGWLFAKCVTLGDVDFTQIHNNPDIGGNTPIELPVGSEGLSPDDSIGGEVNDGIDANSLDNFADVDMYLQPSNDPARTALHGAKNFSIVLEYFYV